MKEKRLACVPVKSWLHFQDWKMYKLWNYMLNSGVGEIKTWNSGIGERKTWGRVEKNYMQSVSIPRIPLDFPGSVLDFLVSAFALVFSSAWKFCWPIPAYLVSKKQLHCFLCKLVLITQIRFFSKDGFEPFFLTILKTFWFYHSISSYYFCFAL